MLCDLLRTWKGLPKSTYTILNDDVFNLFPSCLSGEERACMGDVGRGGFAAVCGQKH